MAVVFVFGLGQQETYQREIPRRRARYQGRSRKDFIRTQDPALSGVTFSDMFRITVLDPVRMVFTEPVVMLSTLFLVFNFAVVFQWFITVPVALGSPMPAGAGFPIDRVGLAFTTAVVGATLAAITSIIAEQITSGSFMKMLGMKMPSTVTAIEYRLVPGMLGSFLVTGALFWIGKNAHSRL